MTLRWRRADESCQLAHCPDHADKNLCYARVYTIGQGYAFSETNQLVFNLKHPPSKPNVQGHKRAAIQRFAAEAAELFQDSDKGFVLVPVPPSRLKGDSDYDDRIDQVAKQICARATNTEYSPLLEGCSTAGPSHQGADRSPEISYASMRVVPEERARWGQSTGKYVVVLDDVLTSGAHFEGARRHLVEQFPNDAILGVFWAKAERLPDDPPF